MTFRLPARLYHTVDAGCVSDDSVALNGEIIFIVLYIDDRLRRIDDFPDDDSSDFYRISKLIIDFLLTIVKRHSLEGNLFRARCDRCMTVCSHGERIL